MTTDRQRVLRIAHITDIHVQPELEAARGMERCLERAQGESPDVIFLGGDMVMDTLECDFDRAVVQWSLFSDVMRANIATPVESCLGNHDVWGWCHRSKYESDPNFGKRYAMHRLGLTTPYRSFDQAGWHFVILDSTHPADGGYTARLDDEQFEWLTGDLANVPADQPVLVLSHIPILGVCPFLDGDNERSGDWRVPGAWMHIDARRIKNLFRHHANVKACLSGHIHLVDQVNYLGVDYYCNGAACGGWWKGPYQEFDTGYAVVDLYADGTVDNRYIEYPWPIDAEGV